MTTLRNFHVPLSEELYQQLQEETRRQHKLATQLARQAIATWLRQQRETTLHEAVRHYAEQMAGTEADLDGELETAAISCSEDGTQRQRPGVPAGCRTDGQAQAGWQAWDDIQKLYNIQICNDRLASNFSKIPALQASNRS